LAAAARQPLGVEDSEIIWSSHCLVVTANWVGEMPMAADVVWCSFGQLESQARR
jgi:hypothetical protein